MRRPLDRETLKSKKEGACRYAKRSRAPARNEPVQLKIERGSHARNEPVKPKIERRLHVANETVKPKIEARSRRETKPCRCAKRSRESTQVVAEMGFKRFEFDSKVGGDPAEGPRRPATDRPNRSKLDFRERFKSLAKGVDEPIGDLRNRARRGRSEARRIDGFRRIGEREEGEMTGHIVRKLGVVPGLLAILVGCVGVRRTEPKIRTITMVGDKASPVVAGTPDDSVVARADSPPSRTDDEGRVSGRVIDREGRGVADAEVRLAINGRAGGRTVRVTTDEAGGFTLHGLLPGETYRLVAERQDDEGLQTGTAVVEAPERLVRIRLRPTDVDAVAAESDRRVDRVSNQVRLEDDPTGEPRPLKIRPKTEEPGSFEPSPRGANPADILPAAEAESLGWKRRESVRIAGDASGPRPETGIDADPTDDNPSPATGSAKESDSTAQQTSTEPIESPPTSQNSQSSSLTDPNDIPNPLPPAREPNSTESAPIDQPSPTTESASPPISFQDPDHDQVPGSDQSSHFPHLSKSSPIQEGSPKPDGGFADHASDEGIGSRSGERSIWASRETTEISAIGRSLKTESAFSETTPETASRSGSKEVEGDRLDQLGETDPGFAANSLSDRPRRHVKWGDLGKAEAENPNAKGELGLSSADAIRTGRSPLGKDREKVLHPPSESRFARLLRRFRGEPNEGPVKASCRFDERSHRLVEFTLPDLTGRPVRFADLNRRADYVLLDFWNVGEDPSAEHLDRIEALRERYGPGKIELATIAYEAGPSASRANAVLSGARRMGSQSALLFGGEDGPCPLRSALHVQEFPTLILVDRQGRIVWRSSESDDKTLARLDRVIAANLEAKQGTFRR